MLSDSSNGSPRSTTPYTMLNIVVFKPIPNARAITAMIVRPGRRARVRSASRMSAGKVLTVAPPQLPTTCW